ncbi:unnamed protein product [Ectocarpus sp. 13 AM-2016]
MEKQHTTTAWGPQLAETHGKDAIESPLPCSCLKDKDLTAEDEQLQQAQDSTQSSAHIPSLLSGEQTSGRPSPLPRRRLDASRTSTGEWTLTLEGYHFVNMYFRY